MTGRLLQGLQANFQTGEQGVQFFTVARLHMASQVGKLKPYHMVMASHVGKLKPYHMVRASHVGKLKPYHMVRASHVGKLKPYHMVMASCVGKLKQYHMVRENFYILCYVSKCKLLMFVRDQKVIFYLLFSTSFLLVSV